MGEYAKYRGESVKIGTCESMYYLRAEHRHLVQHERGNVDPNGEDRFSIRFRFPWPDEDATARPGFDEADHRYDRSVCVHGLSVPAGVEHDMVHFRAEGPGYLLSLPCPEGEPGRTDGLTTSVQGITVHRNGFAGAVHLCQQKLLRDGRTVPVMRCGGCGAKYRLEDASDIEALIVALRSEADRTERASAGSGDWWHSVADRVEAGACREMKLLEAR